MKHYLLTDTELRSRWFQDRPAVFQVEEGTILTPSAQDFIRENNIQLCVKASAPAGMSRTPIPFRDGKPVYQIEATGREVTEKPEDMTHLRGNLLVPKTHPQIAFRGKLDTLQAQILGVQLVADECGEMRVVEDLEDILGYTRAILAAEVKDEPLPELKLLGLGSAEIRRQSHHVKEVFGMEHPIPNYRMGRLCVALNRLRAQVREAELCAAQTFGQGNIAQRPDIIEGLNRMSSSVYIILCRKLSGFYEKEKHA